VNNVDALNKAALTKLEGYFLKPNPTVCLVVAAGAINRSTTFYKACEKVGVLLDVPEEKPWEKEKSLSEWLRMEANKQGKVISHSCCQMLVKQLGTDQMLLKNELDKLICYTGDKTHIDESAIATICGSINTDNGWQLGEAIFNFDIKMALSISKALLADGVAPIALLRQIRSQFQTEFQIATLLASGGGATDVSAQFPYMRGAILERHLRQAASYGLGRFKKGMLAIDAAELQAKNSSADPDFLMELLIVKLYRT
jgi:DNA polymerase-3 subunit delta